MHLLKIIENKLILILILILFLVTTQSRPFLIFQKWSWLGCIFQKKTILCKKFLVHYQISRKVLDFSLFQDHSRISRPVPNFSQIFPGFSWATGPENSCLVPILPIWEVASSLVLSCHDLYIKPQKVFKLLRQNLSYDKDSLYIVHLLTFLLHP